MGQRQVKTADTLLGSKRFGLTVQDNLGARARLADDLNIAPANNAAPTTSERFHGGFLGRKARGVTLILAFAPALAIGLLTSSEDAVAKAPARSGAFERGPDAIDLGQVIAYTKNHRPRLLPNRQNNSDMRSHRTAAFAVPIMPYAIRPTDSVCPPRGR